MVFASYLALEHCRGGALGSEHLKVIGELRHLRYLGLLGTRVAADELDAAGEAVGGLRLLQTLDLRGTAIEAVRARAADVPLRRWSQRGRRAVERDAEAGVPGGGAVALRQRWRRRLQKVLGAPGGRARWVAGAEGGRDQRAGSGGWRRHGCLREVSAKAQEDTTPSASLQWRPSCSSSKLVRPGALR